MKRIFVIIESDLRWRFFSRMHDALIELGFEPVYVTICPTVYLKALKKKYIVKLMKNKIGSDVEKINLATLELKIGDIDEIGNNCLINVFYLGLEEIYRQYNPKKMFVYNGTTVFPMVAGIFAERNNMEVTYFELANLPGKMFVDPKGTNAFSMLFKKPKILDEYNIPFEKYLLWVEDFKSHDKKVKQVKFGKDSLGDYMVFTINKVFFTYYIYGIWRKLKYITSYFSKFKNKFLQTQVSFLNNKTNEELNLKECEYVFLPLQVSCDSQILFHSSVDNIEAIKIANREAVSRGLKLIVKIHPAEQNKKVINEIFRLKKEYNFEIVDTDIKKLIINANKVFAINSTAALEALILEKDIVILGRSLYSYFISNSRYIANYILGYLVDIEYFSDERIDQVKVKTCIERGEVKIQE